MIKLKHYTEDPPRSFVSASCAEHTDYLIAGAGAAGCAIAWLLRRKGCSVLLLELQDVHSKNKLCGGALGDDALFMLETVFGTAALEELPIFKPPHLHSRWMDREIVTPISFAALPRKCLDDWLLAHCTDAGARIRDRMLLTSIDEEAHTVTCRDLRTGSKLQIGYGTLIGADGAMSGVRRLLTGRNQHVNISFEGNVAEFITDIILAYTPEQTGYCWYIPNGGTANAGCMLYEGFAAECKEQLAGFCRELGVETTKLRGAFIPSGDDILLHPGTDIWLIGDAAGLARPFDGGGLHYAFMSADKLASSLLGGNAYEETMSPLTEELTRMAAGRQEWYLFLLLSIASMGNRITPAQKDGVEFPTKL